MIKNRSGFIRVAYLIVLFFFGSGIWVYLKFSLPARPPRAEAPVKKAKVEKQKPVKKTVEKAPEKQAEKKSVEQKTTVLPEAKQPVEAVKPPQPKPVPVTPPPPAQPARQPAPAVKEPAQEQKKPGISGKYAVIVIEDTGESSNLDSFLELGIPLNFSLVASRPNSKVAAEKLRAKNVPFLAAIPMEPDNYPQVNPGAGALLVDLGSEQIRSRLEQALQGLDGAFGITNFMGSKFTSDTEKMRVLLKLVNKSGMLYFDSTTSFDSKAEKVAKELKMSYFGNRLFLDMLDDQSFIRSRFDEFLTRAREGNGFIAVGHANKKNLLPVLREYIPKFRQEKIRFVYLTEI